jgi:hypothetical protein
MSLISIKLKKNDSTTRLLGLTSLTVVEELLIAQSRLYVSIVKLIGTQSSERKSAKKGHVIFFPHTPHTEGPFKLVELQRMNSSNVEP